MVCSICAGTGKLPTGEACVCGNGRADGEVVALRAHIAELEALNAAGSNQVAEMRKYIGELERERDEARNQNADLEDLLMCALRQGAALSHEEGRPDQIDTCGLSTWEEIATYFEGRGKLRKVDGRTYERVTR